MSSKVILLNEVILSAFNEGYRKLFGKKPTSTNLIAGIEIIQKRNRLGKQHLSADQRSKGEPEKVPHLSGNLSTLTPPHPDTIRRAYNNKPGSKDGVNFEHNDRSVLDLLSHCFCDKPWLELLKELNIDEKELVVIYSDSPLNWDDPANYVEQLYQSSYEHDLNSLFMLEMVPGVYSKYHLDRVDCSVHRIDDNIFKDGVIEHCGNWYGITSLLNRKVTIQAPAADWYFMYDQRAFLKDNLVSILKEIPKDTEVSICEVFSPSYIHHFTYVSVIIDALKAAKRNQTVKLTVMESFAFPLIQILAVDQELKRHGCVYPKTIFSLDPQKLPDFSIRQDFVDFIIERFDVEFYNRMIGTPNIIKEAPHDVHNSQGLKFDIITEHFLMKTKKKGRESNKLWVQAIREKYKSFTDKEVRLICACGEKIQSGFDYMQLHKDLGFELVNEKMTWDVYEEKRDNLDKLKKGDTVKPNCQLLHWRFNR